MSCARPTLTKRGLSTYSVLGFIGYGVASVFGAVLMARWQLAISERLVVAFVPPLDQRRRRRITGCGQRLGLDGRNTLRALLPATIADSGT